MNTNKTKGDILAERIEAIRHDFDGLQGISETLGEALAEYRTLWTLGRSVNGHTLADGQEWHRQDWSEDMLPDGWRPLILTERREDDDEIFGFLGVGPWIRFAVSGAGHAVALFDSIHTRTRRPLPAVVEKWTVEKQAFKEGKKIEWSNPAYRVWQECERNDPPQWLRGIEYRVKPEPVMVELGPEDVPPGSATREIGCRTWRLVTEVKSNGFSTHGENTGAFYGWGYAQKKLEISRDGGTTWERCEKEGK